MQIFWGNIDETLIFSPNLSLNPMVRLETIPIKFYDLNFP